MDRAPHPQDRMFPGWLQAERKRKGWSQTKLGDHLDPKVDKKTVGRWENGHNKPRWSTYLQICSLFDVEPVAESQREAIGAELRLVDDRLEQLDGLLAFYAGFQHEIRGRAFGFEKVGDRSAGFTPELKERFDEGREAASALFNLGYDPPLR